MQSGLGTLLFRNPLMWKIRRFECSDKTIGLFFRPEISEFFEFLPNGGRKSLGKVKLNEMADFMLAEDLILLDRELEEKQPFISGSRVRFLAMNWPDGKDNFRRVDADNKFSVWSPQRQCYVVSPRSPFFRYPSDVEQISPFDNRRGVIECGGRSVVMEWFPEDEEPNTRTIVKGTSRDFLAVCLYGDFLYFLTKDFDLYFWNIYHNDSPPQPIGMVSKMEHQDNPGLVVDHHHIYVFGTSMFRIENNNTNIPPLYERKLTTDFQNACLVLYSIFNQENGSSFLDSIQSEYLRDILTELARQNKMVPQFDERAKFKCSLDNKWREVTICSTIPSEIVLLTNPNKVFLRTDGKWFTLQSFANTHLDNKYGSTMGDSQHFKFGKFSPAIFAEIVDGMRQVVGTTDEMRVEMENNNRISFALIDLERDWWYMVTQECASLAWIQWKVQTKAEGTRLKSVPEATNEPLNCITLGTPVLPASSYLICPSDQFNLTSNVKRLLLEPTLVGKEEVKSSESVVAQKMNNSRMVPDDELIDLELRKPSRIEASKTRTVIPQFRHEKPKDIFLAKEHFTQWTDAMVNKFTSIQDKLYMAQVWLEYGKKKMWDTSITVEPKTVVKVEKMSVLPVWSNDSNDKVVAVEQKEEKSHGLRDLVWMVAVTALGGLVHKFVIERKRGIAEKGQKKQKLDLNPAVKVAALQMYNQMQMNKTANTPFQSVAWFQGQIHLFASFPENKADGVLATTWVMFKTLFEKIKGDKDTTIARLVSLLDREWPPYFGNRESSVKAKKLFPKIKKTSLSAHMHPWTNICLYEYMLQDNLLDKTMKSLCVDFLKLFDLEHLTIEKFFQLQEETIEIPRKILTLDKPVHFPRATLLSYVAKPDVASERWKFRVQPLCESDFDAGVILFLLSLAKSLSFDPKLCEVDWYLSLSPLSDLLDRYGSIAVWFFYLAFRFSVKHPAVHNLCRLAMTTGRKDEAVSLINAHVSDSTSVSIHFTRAFGTIPELLQKEFEWFLDQRRFIRFKNNFQPTIDNITRDLHVGPTEMSKRRLISNEIAEWRRRRTNLGDYGLLRENIHPFISFGFWGRLQYTDDLSAKKIQEIRNSSVWLRYKFLQFELTSKFDKDDPKLKSFIKDIAQEWQQYSIRPSGEGMFGVLRGIFKSKLPESLTKNSDSSKTKEITQTEFRTNVRNNYRFPYVVSNIRIEEEETEALETINWKRFLTKPQTNRFYVPVPHSVGKHGEIKFEIFINSDVSRTVSYSEMKAAYSTSTTNRFLPEARVRNYFHVRVDGFGYENQEFAMARTRMSDTYLLFYTEDNKRTIEDFFDPPVPKEGVKNVFGHIFSQELTNGTIYESFQNEDVYKGKRIFFAHTKVLEEEREQKKQMRITDTKQLQEERDRRERVKKIQEENRDLVRLLGHLCITILQFKTPLRKTASNSAFLVFFGESHRLELANTLQKSSQTRKSVLFQTLLPEASQLFDRSGGIVLAAFVQTKNINYRQFKAGIEDCCLKVVPLSTIERKRFEILFEGAEELVIIKEASQSYIPASFTSKGVGWYMQRKYFEIAHMNEMNDRPSGAGFYISAEAVNSLFNGLAGFLTVSSKVVYEQSKAPRQLKPELPKEPEGIADETFDRACCFLELHHVWLEKRESAFGVHPSKIDEYRQAKSDIMKKYNIKTLDIVLVKKKYIHFILQPTDDYAVGETYKNHELQWVVGEISINVFNLTASSVSMTHKQQSRISIVSRDVLTNLASVFVSLGGRI